IQVIADRRRSLAVRFQSSQDESTIRLESCTERRRISETARENGGTGEIVIRGSNEQFQPSLKLFEPLAHTPIRPSSHPGFVCAVSHIKERHRCEIVILGKAIPLAQLGLDLVSHLSAVEIPQGLTINARR